MFCSSALKSAWFTFPTIDVIKLKGRSEISKGRYQKNMVLRKIYTSGVLICGIQWTRETEPTWRKYNTIQKRRISNSFMNETWLKITTTKSDKYYMSTQAIFRNLPQENLIKHLLKLFLEYVTNIYHSLLHRNFKVSWKELFHSY